MSTFEQKLETVGQDVVKGLEFPFKFVVKAEKVLETAIADQPQLKTVLTTLVQKAEEIAASGVAAAGSKGLNLAADAATLQEIEAFFTWFEQTVVPVIECVYSEIKADLTSPVTPLTAPATTVA